MKNQNNLTSLQLALKNKNISLQVVKYFVENKTDLNFENEKNEKISDFEKVKKKIEILKTNP